VLASEALAQPGIEIDGAMEYIKTSSNAWQPTGQLQGIIYDPTRHNYYYFSSYYYFDDTTTINTCSTSSSSTTATSTSTTTTTTSTNT
jgi:hypothetical protein